MTYLGSHSKQEAEPGLEPGRVVPGSVLFAAAHLVDLCGRHGRGTGCCSARTPRRGHCLPALGAAGGPSDRIRFQFRFLLVYTLISASGNLSAQRLRPDARRRLRLRLLPAVLREPAGRAPGPVGPTLRSYHPCPGGILWGLPGPAPGHQPRVDFVGQVTSFQVGRLGLLARTGASKAGQLPAWGHQWGS